MAVKDIIEGLDGILDKATKLLSAEEVTESLDNQIKLLRVIDLATKITVRLGQAARGDL